jgi:hypothetical protein
MTLGGDIGVDGLEFSWDDVPGLPRLGAASSGRHRCRSRVSQAGVENTIVRKLIEDNQKGLNEGFLHERKFQASSASES